MDHSRVIGVPAANRADQQYCSTKVLVELVKTLSDGAHERWTMEKRKYEIEVVEITVDEVEHEVRFRELEPHVWGF